MWWRQCWIWLVTVCFTDISERGNIAGAVIKLLAAWIISRHTATCSLICPVGFTGFPDRISSRYWCSHPPLPSPSNIRPSQSKPVIGAPSCWCVLKVLQSTDNPSCRRFCGKHSQSFSSFFTCRFSLSPVSCLLNKPYTGGRERVKNIPISAGGLFRGHCFCWCWSDYSCCCCLSDCACWCRRDCCCGCGSGCCWWCFWCRGCGRRSWSSESNLCSLLRRYFRRKIRFLTGNNQVQEVFVKNILYLYLMFCLMWVSELTLCD